MLRPEKPIVEVAMSVTAQVPVEKLTVKKSIANSSVLRVLRFSVKRLLTLFVTVVIGIYLTILIANMGGFVDEIIKGQIRDTVTQRVANNPNALQMEPELRKKLIEDQIALEEKRRGLNTPIAVRNFRYLSN